MAKHESSSGKTENIKGRVKQAAGSVMGNKKMEAEGAAERAHGAAKEKVEQIEKKAGKSDTDLEDEDEEY